MIPALPLSMVSSRPRRARERKAREDALAQEVPNGRPAGIHWRVFLLKDIYNKKALKSHRFEKVWLSVARRSVGWIFQIWICPWGLSNISIYIHISLYIYISPFEGTFELMIFLSPNGICSLRDYHGRWRNWVETCGSESHSTWLNLAQIPIETQRLPKKR